MNPGLAGLEFRERPVPFPKLPNLAGSEFGKRTVPNPGSAGSEFGERTGPALVLQVRSSEKARFLSPNSEEKKKM